MFSHPMLKEDSLIPVMAQPINLAGQGTPIPGVGGQLTIQPPPQGGVYPTCIPGLAAPPPIPFIPAMGGVPYTPQPIGAFPELMPFGDYGSEDYHKRIYVGYNREYGNYVPYTWTTYVKAAGAKKENWVVKDYPYKVEVQKMEKTYQDKVKADALQKAMALTQGFQIPALPGVPTIPGFPIPPPASPAPGIPSGMTIPGMEPIPVMPVMPMGNPIPPPTVISAGPPGPLAPGAIPPNFTIAPITIGTVNPPTPGGIVIGGLTPTGNIGGYNPGPAMTGPIGITAGLAVVNVQPQKKKTRTGPSVGSFTQVDVTQLKPRLSNEPYPVTTQQNINIPINIQTQIQPRPETRPIPNPNIVPIAAYTPGQNIIEILSSIDQSKLSTKRSVKGKTYTVEELRDFVSRMGLLVGTPNKAELINVIKTKLLENKLLAE